MAHSTSTRVACLALSIFGVVAALIVGIWFMLIGGIEEIVRASLQSHPIWAGELAWGIVRVLFCESAVILFLPCWALATYLWE